MLRHVEYKTSAGAGLSRATKVDVVQKNLFTILRHLDGSKLFNNLQFVGRLVKHSINHRRYLQMILSASMGRHSQPFQNDVNFEYIC